ncbi:hypothetical protein, partial [Mycobacterium sp. E3298]|uniref:hypothetical protein n=1 Tax=Mycobacterium sp. E3298 TaxID=1856865 RepID=UPI001E29CD4E
ACIVAALFNGAASPHAAVRRASSPRCSMARLLLTPPCGVHRRRAVQWRGFSSRRRAACIVAALFNGAAKRLGEDRSCG